MSDMVFDRQVSDELVDVLTSGPARTLVGRARGDVPRYDLQFRADPKRPYDSRATLYAGDTAVLTLEHHQQSPRKPECFTLKVHEKHAIFGPDVPWGEALAPADLSGVWPNIEDYLKEVDGSELVAKALAKEGGVHVGISSATSDAYRVVQREAVPGFTDGEVRKSRRAAWRVPFAKAVDEADTGEDWWPRSEKWSVGTKLDFLAVDIAGRLLAMEVKHHKATADELSKVAIQAGTYAAMFADLLAETDGAVAAIDGMLAQRTMLGLTRTGRLHLLDEGRVAPVIAIGPGHPSDEVHRRIWDVARVVDAAGATGRNVDPFEIWYVDELGCVNEVERAQDVVA